MIPNNQYLPYSPIFLGITPQNTGDPRIIPQLVLSHVLLLHILLFLHLLLLPHLVDGLSTGMRGTSHLFRLQALLPPPRVLGVFLPASKIDFTAYFHVPRPRPLPSLRPRL